MYRHSILIVEDNANELFLLKQRLDEKKCIIRTVSTIHDAMIELKKRIFDLLVLDRILPDGDGLDVLSYVRNSGMSVRVLVFSARGKEQERVHGLKEGADDYLPKPYTIDELELRIFALLKRSVLYDSNPQEKNGVQFLHDEGLVVYHQNSTVLSATEKKAFQVLYNNFSRVVTRHAMMQSIWPPDGMPEEGSLDVLIARVRKKIRELGLRIRTVHSVGYALDY